MPHLESSRPASMLLVEPDGGIALTLQEILRSHFQTAFDLGTARSLREGMAYLCAHRVTVILLDLTLPDCPGLDAVRALRRTAPAGALIALSAAADETLLLDAIRAGAHEACSLASPAAQELRLTIERAMIRAGQPGMSAGSTSPIPPAEPSPALRKLVHDLNNAITSINGFTDILLARLPAEEPARTSAEQIRKAGARAVALVKTLAPPPASSPAVSASDPGITARAA